ncbi:hypothetical protein [Frankia sp. R82]|uniref:hypothetical protein n=1 Tax=Frankia sp. R82 TaxID=2950553 RepID=UPI002044C315|nr:hypothetical protein [Frankia sp. R82]MCM3884126.1 hypothetical protein [Frankia sp. R82]
MAEESRVGQTSIPGHGLQREGRAFTVPNCCGYSLTDTTPQLGEPGRYGGHGVCRCGEVSDHFDSTAARRRWHNRHKDEIRRGFVGSPAAEAEPPAPEGAGRG